MKPASESELYRPVADYLIDRGYEVRGEVRGIDLVAMRGDDLLVVELKLRMSLELILQAVDRQRSADSVYVAVAARPKATRRKSLSRTHALLRRLEIGLIVVHFRPSGPRVELLFHPTAPRPKRKPHEGRAIIGEFSGRSGDYNTGGSKPTPIVTAYREQSVYIGCALANLDTASPAELRSLGTGDKTGSILYRDVYGWFERIDRGRYRLSERGRLEIDSHPDLRVHYEELVRERLASVH